MTTPLPAEKCVKKVSDHTGFHFWQCRKPAKFRVSFGNGPAIPVCGIHARSAKRRDDAVVVPL